MLKSSLIFLIFLFVSPVYADSEIASIDELPVLEGGRIKPFDTLARESLQMVYGKSKFEGEPAGKIIATWMMVPDIWESKEFVKVEHHALKKALGLDMNKKLFVYKDLVGHSRLSTLFTERRSKAEAKEPLNSFDHAVSRLETQLVTFQMFRHGAMRVAPSRDKEEAAWVPIGQLEEGQRELFFKLLKSYAATFVKGIDSAKADEKYKSDLLTFVGSARANNPNNYANNTRIKVEVFHNKFQPLQWAWVFYAFAFTFLLLNILIGKSIIFKLGLGFTGIAFLLHTMGFVIRVYLANRPPVSNMYETVIWVGWGAIIFATMIFVQKRKQYIMVAGVGVSFLCMVVADFSPVILDPSIKPLQAVLRSNMWLIIHVMPITLSYAAFFLALALGNVGLIQILRGESEKGARIREIVDSAYRSIQVGIVLLAAGTILGGVWADYSWGRFWGWDPKEVWAFVSLMGYLALLHGRLVGWFRAFGMLVGSVVTFSLVIMAWYGVNFVLGAGLHSYGFGAGGLQYVASFLGVQFLFVIYVTVVRAMRSKSAS